MRVGCTSYSFRKEINGGEMRIQDFMKTCQILLLDGVELASYYTRSTWDIKEVLRLGDVNIDYDEFRTIKRSAVDLGLDIRAVSVGNEFCGLDPDVQRMQVLLVKRWTDIALYLGAPILRVFAGRVPEGQLESEAFVRAVRAFRECADYASAKGVILALENHGGITSTANQVLNFMKAVDSPSFRFLLDTGNFTVDLYDEMERTLSYVVHVHAKFIRIPEGGDQSDDYHRIVEMLRQSGYAGYLSIEYEGEEPAIIAVPKIASFLRGLVVPR